MKTVVITVPMMPLDAVKSITYPMDGNKAIEYGEPVRCPINGVLAKTMKNGEKIKVIYIVTTGSNSYCQQMKEIFIAELEHINKEIGAILSYDTVEMEFRATMQTYNKLILDLAEIVPDNAEIFADITYGFKTEVLSFVCALRFLEEFRDATVQHFIYAKLERNYKTRQYENPMIYDITS
ncbi:MAG: hypothetical protein FWC10_10885, partial [Lentimicrobiaceae bacterium]|nr:hypothetical protein [Lentimicrobiaceae bacterium]